MVNIIILLFAFFCCYPCFAAPRINFSDLVSGPATGLGDGLGDGAIVTIWGNRLGSSQGTSTLSVCGASPSHIYYWKNADGQLPGGPADLYTSHKMQEIAFSLPSSCSTGATTISVTVGGQTSNTLPFTVRPGGIKFIKSTGSDTTGNGSWSNPYLTINSVFDGNNGKISAGDTIYSVGVGSSTGIKVGANATVSGTASAHIAFTSYPNTTVAISGAGGIDTVVDNWWPSNRHNQYVDFSKFKVTAYGNINMGLSPYGFSVIPYGRIVGVEITGPNVYYGMQGAIGGGAGVPQGGKYLGIYIHDYGYDTGWDYVDDWTLWNTSPYDGIAGEGCTNCTTVDSLQHLYYITCRVAGVTCEGYEIGWNNLKDNSVLEGIHIFDSNGGYGWHGTLSVHDNMVTNQMGAAIDVVLPPGNTASLEVYNNVVANDNGPSFKIEVGAATPSTKIYNNTFYNQSVRSLLTYPVGIDFRNNIMYDSLGVIFMGSSGVPNTHSNNLFYSSAGTVQPSWATSESGHTTGDPLFVNAAIGDFSLQNSSPAINQGIVGISGVDILSRHRPSGASWDIGAYEFDNDTLVPNILPTQFRIPGGVPYGIAQ